MEVPRLSKVVVSMGVGAATQDPKILENAMRDLAAITGQQPAISRAKRSIAQFRVREKNPIGCKVTLRGDRMYEFVDRLISVALPRIRDFRGLPPEAVDGRGNYNLGLREQSVFPEIDIDKVTRVQGMNVTIVTTARTDEEALALLREFGLPLRES
jgi:large subunit ribosomal protein L5